MGLDSKSRASRRVSPSFCLMGPCLGGRKDEKGRGCRCARYDVGLDGDGCSSQELECDFCLLIDSAMVWLPTTQNDFIPYHKFQELYHNGSLAL
uniref:Uncharacterized protein n=1 Tax=Aegilops tauschii TaxID=37682 RepID=M8C061_AEGTA